MYNFLVTKCKARVANKHANEDTYSACEALHSQRGQGLGHIFSKEKKDDEYCSTAPFPSPNPNCEPMVR